MGEATKLKCIVSEICIYECLFNTCWLTSPVSVVKIQDPGSRMQDPGTWIADSGSRIPDPAYTPYPPLPPPLLLPRTI